MSERPVEENDDEAEPAPQTIVTDAYPGWLDQRLLTPRAPLAPGEDIGLIPGPMLHRQRSSPPVWAPDPTGRHQWRWWGGVAWTDHVADDGVASEDPLRPD